MSAWSKPGAWALDSEQHEEELLQQNDIKTTTNDTAVADFPPLAVAAATKPKKKKAQTLSLAEFAAKPDSLFTRHEDPVELPTGPRERTAEELDRTRLGGGFRSYGGDRSNRNSGGEDSSSRWGSSRVSDESRRNGGSFRDSNREIEPSRADEVDNWAAGKKSTGNGFERRDREKERGGFFDSQSRADESDRWVSSKSFAPSEGRRFSSGGGGGFERERKVGFGTSGGADSDNWNKKKGEFSVGSERTENVGGGGGGFEGERKVGFGTSGGADSDNWNKKKGEFSVGSDRTESAGVVGARPRLVLQPRSLSASNETEETGPGKVEKPKGVNPFGEARPREQVLAEKGQDWKKIDEQLESVKIKETVDLPVKKGFGSSNGGARLPEEKTERSWRKALIDDVRPKRFVKNFKPSWLWLPLLFVNDISY